MNLNTNLGKLKTEQGPHANSLSNWRVNVLWSRCYRLRKF